MRRTSIKRTEFKRVPGTSRKTKGERIPGTARYSSLNRYGKKAKLREKINAPLRAKFKRLGLFDVCEAKLDGCWNQDLTWMHGKKDRLLTMEERSSLVIRACVVCHSEVELWGHERMLAFVENVIAERELAA